MGKKEREYISFIENESLTFTEADRQQTLQQIHTAKKKRKRTSTSYIGPTIATMLIVILAIGVIMPSLYTKDNQAVSTDVKNTFSVLILAEESHRSVFQLVLTYNSAMESIKLVPIPRDAYATIIDAHKDNMWKDKIANAMAYNQEIEPVIATFENYLDVPIDYYAVISTEFLKDWVETDKHRSTTKMVWDKINYKENSSKLVEQLTEQIESTNLSSAKLDKIRDGIHSFSIETKDITIKKKKITVDGIYYEKIDEGVLNQISNELNEHLNEK